MDIQIALLDKLQFGRKKRTRYRPTQLDKEKSKKPVKSSSRLQIDHNSFLDEIDNTNVILDKCPFCYRMC